MQKKYVLMLFMMFFCGPSYSQTSIGIHLEPMVGLNSGSNSATGKSVNELLVHVGVGFSVNFKTSEADLISVRPAYIFSSFYSGFDGALLYKMGMTDNWNLLFGVNAHFNSGNAGHTESSKSVQIPYLVGGAGIHLSPKSIIEIQLHYSLNPTDFGYRRETVSAEPYYIYHNQRMPVLLKVSFGLMP